MERHYITHIQVRNNCLVLYGQPELPPNHARNTEGFKKAYSGQMASGTQKRIRKALDIFLQLTPEKTIWNPVIQYFHPFRLGFTTLTIHDEKQISGKEAHAKLLKPWLRWAGTQGVRNYIWKAELQERGVLHYHVTVDSFLHMDSIRYKWNGLQKREGLLDNFARKHCHFNPNSTDVHSVKTVKDLEAYLAKYIAKSEQNQKSIGGKVWDCSVRLKDTRFSWELDSATEKNILKAIKSNEADRIKLDNCEIIRFKNPESLLSDNLKGLYSSWKNNLPLPEYIPPPPPQPPPRIEIKRPLQSEIEF